METNSYIVPISRLDWARQSEALAKLSDVAFAERCAAASLAFGATEVQALLEESARRFVQFRSEGSMASDNRVSLPADLPGPCPVCLATVTDGDDGNAAEHLGHCAGYNRAIADVVAWLMELDRKFLQEGKATGSACYLANAVQCGDAFGAGRR